MYIIPNKSTDPDLTVLAVAVSILQHVKKKKIALYSDVYHIIHKKNEKASYFFNLALELLFILSLIEYYPKNDLIEYIGK